MPEHFLPADLRALADGPRPALLPLAVRVDPTTAARIEAMRSRLNRPSKGALMRFLLAEGLRHAETALEAAADG